MERYWKWAAAIATSVTVMLVACSKSTGPDDDGGNGGGGSLSPDLDSAWTVRVSGTGENLKAVACSGVRFVAVGDSGKVLSSADGVTWTKIGVSATRLSDVLWTGSAFIAVGEAAASAGHALVARSADGVTWTSEVVTNGGRATGVTRAANGNVVVAAQNQLLTSTSGQSWTVQTAAPPSVDWWVLRLTGGIWATPVGTFAKAEVTRPTGTFGIYVRMVGGYFDTTMMQQPLGDDLVWTGTQAYSANEWSTTDGTTWIKRPDCPVGIYGLLWTDTLIVAVGYGGNVAWSPDGITWQSRSTGVASALRGVAFSGTRYVAVGDGGVIVTRP